jgi:hypothetical protein
MNKKQLIENMNKVKELSFELHVMNKTLLNNVGDIPEKSIKNFAGEINRINGALLEIVDACLK